MKKFLQSMLLIALFAVPFATQAQSFFEEDFESSSTGTIPAGWTKMKGGSSVGVSTSYKCSGSKSFKFEGASTSDPVSMVAISGLTVEANTTEMTFNTRNEGTYANCGSFSVGYVTSLTDPTTFVAIETYNASEFNGSCQEFTVAFNSAPAGAYIAFRQTPVGTSYNYYWFIDNIDVHALPTCPQPIGLTFSNLTATSVDIAWTASGEESEWELTIGNEDPISITDNPSYSIETLTPQTSYTVTIRAICGDGDTSRSISGSFTTPCMAIASDDLPYIMDFESATSGSSNLFDPCWTTYKSGSSYYPYVGTTASSAYQGSRYLYFTGNSNYYVALPQFETPISQLQLSFMAKYSSSNPFAVGVMTDPSDLSTFDTIAVYRSTSNYTNFTTYFSTYEGNGTFMAIRTSNYLYIDSIAVDLKPSCTAPANFRATNITEESADIEWAETGEATSWTIEYGEAGFTRGEGTTEIATNIPFSISNLSANTAYDVYIIPGCSDDDNPLVLMGSFRTSCGEMTLPYTDGFESYPISSQPPCWFVITNGEGSAPYIENMSSSYSSWASGHAYHINGTNAIATPYIPIPINTLDLSFRVAKEGSSSNTLIVGFLPSLDSALSSMVRLAVYNYGEGQYKNYFDVEIDCSTIEALQDNTDNGYIVFQSTGSTSWYWWIDDVIIAQASDCKRPTEPSVSNISHNSATISWNDITEAGNYDVAYSTVNDVDSSITTILNNISETTVTLTNLDGLTTYYAWVRTVCSDEATPWTNVGNFTTLQSCARVLDAEITGTNLTSASIAWTLDTLEGEPATGAWVEYKADTADSWEGIAVTNNYCFLTGLRNGTNYNVRIFTLCDNDSSRAVSLNFSTNSCGEIAEATTTSGYAPMYGLYNYSYAQSIYPATDMTGIDTIRGISFHTSGAPSSYPNRTLSVYLGNTSLNSVSTSNYVQLADLTQVVNNASVNFGTAGWIYIPFESEFVYDGQSNLVVAVTNNTGSYSSFSFYHHTGSLGNSVCWYQDSGPVNPASPSASSTNTPSTVPDVRFDVTCNLDQCAVPIVAVGTVTTEQIDIEWIGDATNYMVQYRVVGDMDWISEDVTTTTYSFSGLQAATKYEFRVAALCDDTIYSATTSLYTACNLFEIPYHETFTSHENNPCWTYSSSSVYFSSSNNYLYMYGNTYVALPQFDAAMNTLQVRLSAKKSSTSYTNNLIIGIADNPSYLTAIDTIPLTTTETEYTVRLNNYEGDASHIVILNNSTYGTTYIYDLVVEEIPSCMQAEDVEVSNVTSTTATIAWDEDGTLTTEYLINYGPVGGAMTSVSAFSSDDSIQLVGLNPATDYVATVTTICGGDSARVSNTVTFSTACDIITQFPWSQGFESLSTDGDLPNCWDNSEGSTSTDSYRWSYNSTYGTGFSGKCIRFDSYVNSTGNTNYLKTPILSLPAGQPMQLTFMYKNPTGGDYSVYISTDGGATHTTSIATGLTGVADWTEFEYSLANYAGMDSVCIVFKGTSNYGSGDARLYLDEVSVAPLSSCPKVLNATASAVSPNSIAVSFSDTVDAGSYTIVWGTSSDLASVTDSVTFTDTTYTISGLTAQTTYNLWVRTNCANEASNYVALGAVTTPCDVFPLADDNPFTEDFESSAIGPCWSNFKIAGPGNTDWATSTTYHHNGSRSAYIADQSATTRHLLVSRPLLIPEGEVYQLSFWAYHLSSTSYGTKVLEGVRAWVNTTPDTVGGTVLAYYHRNLDLISPAGFVQYESIIPMDGQVYVIFEGINEYGGSSYIDDVEVSKAPTCYRPQNLTVSNLSFNAATLSWSGNGSSYAVEYRPIDSTAWNRIVVSDTFVNLTTLTSATEYEARVRALCSATDSSDYSLLIEFSTPCDAFLLSATNSFTEDFESTSIGACWGNFKIAGPGSYPWKTSTTYAHGGSRSGYIQDQSATTRHLLVSRPLMVPEGEFYQLSFWVYQLSTTSYSSYVEEGVRAWVNTTPDTVGGTVLAYHHRNVDLGSVSGWIKYEANIPIDGQQIYVIFEGINEYGGASYIDDVEVSKAPTCPRVSNIEVTDATTSSITLDWDDIATPMAWEIEYGQAGFTQGTGTSVVVSSKPATISSLTTSTNYAFYIRPICSDSDTGRWIEQPFFAATNCAVVDVNASSPFFQGFESANAPAACWTMVYGNNNPATNPMTHNSERHYDADSGVVSTRSFRFSSMSSTTPYDQYLITPELNISGNGVVRFAYSGYIYGEEQFKVGYSTTTNELSAFTWGSEILLEEDDSWHIYNDSIGDSIKYVAIHYYSDYQYYVFIDNFSVTSDGGGCSAPAVTSVNQTYENIVMNWTAANDSCEVAITNTVWNDNLPTTLVIGNTYTFANLTPATTYTVGVRQVCGEGVTSAWTTRTVTTDSLPCFAPTALAFVSATYHTATLSWTAGGEETHWNVRIFNTTFDSTYTATATYTTTATNATFGGLQAGVAYTALVRSMCGSNGQIEGDWCADTLSFTTADCAPVANLTAAAAATDAIQLSWTNGGIEQAWVIEYADDPDFGQGEGTVVNVNSNPATVTGLEPNTEYFFYIYAQCEEALRSIASNRANATTYDVGINDVNGATSIAIYPNPAQNATTISVSGVEGKVSISIVDLNGRAVFNDNMECEGDCVKTLDVEGLAQGAYFVRIYGENVNSVKKLIVR